MNLDDEKSIFRSVKSNDLLVNVPEEHCLDSFRDISRNNDQYASQCLAPLSIPLFIHLVSSWHNRWDSICAHFSRGNFHAEMKWNKNSHFMNIPPRMKGAAVENKAVTSRTRLPTSTSGRRQRGFAQAAAWRGMLSTCVGTHRCALFTWIAAPLLHVPIDLASFHGSCRVKAKSRGEKKKKKRAPSRRVCAGASVDAGVVMQLASQVQPSCAERNNFLLLVYDCQVFHRGSLGKFAAD